MKKILVFDNYDSFTYNLVNYLQQITDQPIEVHRNNEISLEDVGRYDKILLSPGPGIPSEAGILLPVIKTYAASKSIFGVCLGHQAIIEAFGGKIHNMNKVFHGVATDINVHAENELLFRGLPKTFKAGRYHSWVGSEEGFPAELEITATDNENKIMAIAHRTLDVRGVQFHPESILTEFGMEIMKNWVNS